MANNYSTVKLKSASEKIILARLNPARYITNDLSLDSGTTYTMTFPFIALNAIEVDGTAYTSVSSAPSSTEYQYTESTGELNINFGAAIGTKVVVAYYYLFYTNDRNRVTYQDPENNATTLRSWSGRISNVPDFYLSQRDVIEGFLTIGSTQLRLFNQDVDFQQYLTDNDSFFNKEVKIWTCLDNLDNIKKQYEGQVSSINLRQEVILSIDSNLANLLGTYYSNDTWLKSTFNITTYPSVINQDIDRPIPKFFSKVTHFQANYDKTWNSSTSLGALGSGVPLQDAPRAVNTNFNSSSSTSVNRDWACYVANATDGSFSDGIASVASHGLSRYTLTLDGADYTWCVPGDSIYINAVANFGYVERVSGSGIRIFCNTIVPTTSHTFNRPEISRVIIVDPLEQKNNLSIRMDLVYNRDYTYSTDANGVREINLVSNFEANHTEYTGPLDAAVSVYYRAWNDDTLEHGTIVNTILSDAGLTVDSTSISTANSTSIELNFSVPFKDELSFPTRQNLLKNILSTTLGVLSLASDFEIEYLLLNAPTTGATTTTKNETLLNSFYQSIQYKDIVSEIRYFNRHGQKYYANGDLFTTLTDTINTDNDVSNKVKNLHGIEKIKDIEHVAADTTNTFTRLKNILYERRGIYSFTTKGQHFESELGDDVTLSRNDIIGGSATKDVTIISLKKKMNETEIAALDLLGL